MGFHKAINGKIKAGSKAGKSGFGAAKAGSIRRWPGTEPTAYWRVDGIAADSTTLPDVSIKGHGLDATLGGTVDESGSDATWNSTSPDGSTQSLRFNGTDNKATIAYNAKLKPSNAIKKVSISMWIKTDQNNDYFLCAESDAASATAGWVYCAVGVGTGAKANVYWNTASGANWRASSTAVNDDEWHHLVFVYNGDEANEISTYVDGELEVSNSAQSGDFVLANVPILLGYRRHGGANYYKYFMDEIAYWTDIALTADQVADLYNKGKVTNSFAGIRRS